MSTTRAAGGLFLTFEGTDGSGKSTQMHMLAAKLRGLGYDVAETVEPGGTRIGKQIRGILLDPAHQEMSPAAELLLYFAARAQNVEEFIRPALDAGKIVLSDRYTDSTLAYQGVARGLGAGVVMQLHQLACRDLQPRLTLCFDVDVETGLERIRSRAVDRMDAQAIEFHHKVRAAYRELAAREPRVRLIDGSREPEAVFESTWEAVAPLLPAIEPSHV
jgi:dTMP kinase